MLIYAMKTKQSTDLQYTEKLSATVDKFAEAYFDPEEHKHLQEHKH